MRRNKDVKVLMLNLDLDFQISLLLSEMASGILARTLRQGLLKGSEAVQANVGAAQALHTSPAVNGTLQIPDRLKDIPSAAVSNLK